MWIRGVNLAGPDAGRAGPGLAGPGSGKTRLVVHRVAFLARVLREAPQSILVVTFNRHAAREVRRRLHELIGDDAYAVNKKRFEQQLQQSTGR